MEIDGHGASEAQDTSRGGIGTEEVFHLAFTCLSNRRWSLLLVPLPLSRNRNGGMGMYGAFSAAHTVLHVGGQEVTSTAT